MEQFAAGSRKRRRAASRSAGVTRMLMARNAISKVVLIRPGALGDVLAVRSTVRFFKDAFPAAEICLVAPGERGMFLCREGWADRAFDWDRSAFSWLFSPAEGEPPPVLRAVFGGSDIVVSYQDFTDPDDLSLFEERLHVLAPAAGKVYCPSRPPAGQHVHINEWLLRAAAAFFGRYGLLGDYDMNFERLLTARIRLSAPFPPFAMQAPYVVMHPGSGSTGKNWPLAGFVELGRRLLSTNGNGKEARFRSLVVTSGEADGDLGVRLAAAVPGAILASTPTLVELAPLLANAGLYVGNDSGVSHLAASLKNAADGVPCCAVIFGTSDARVWGPAGALILHAGAAMHDLTPERAAREIQAFLAAKER